MTHVWKILLMDFIWIAALAGCGFTGPAKTQDQIVDAVWTDLDPYTRSHNRANWLVKEITQKRGDQAAQAFEGKPFSCIYPQPPANQAIQPEALYWVVQMAPKPATPAAPRLSPTAPPAVPEPTLYQAFYLVDLTSGRVVARKLFCVIY